MKSFLKYLAVLLSAFLILFFMLFVIITGLTQREITVYDNSYLHITLSGSLPDYEPDDPFEEFLGTPTLNLKEVRDVLEKAAVDDRIEGVFLELAMLQCGFAKVEELQSYIDSYRESGKKIYAYSEFASMRDLLVASACDSFFMPSNANLFLTGLGSEVVFYKDFFEKIGVKASFVNVGKYKNAPDGYTRNSISDEQRFVLNTVLDELYESQLQSLSGYLDLDETTLENFIDDISGFTGREAQNAGLVDSTLFRHEVLDLIKPSGLRRISANDYSMIPASSLGIRDGKSRIAVVHISGTIAPGGNADDPLLGNLAGAETIVKNIESAAASSSVKAIILRIDSPGGVAISANAIWDAVMRAKKKKPVIASIADYGASGGYYAAMAADTIVTGGNSLIGSIGIFAGKFSISGLYEKLGIQPEILKRGKNATLFSTTTEWSESERAVIQRLIYDYYVDFVSKVADNRGMSYEKAESVAQGRVWSGTAGFEHNLADILGGFYTAVELAAEMAGIESGDAVRLSYYPKEEAWLDDLYGRVQTALKPEKALLGSFEAYIANIQNKPLALMPVWIKWN